MFREKYKQIKKSQKSKSRIFEKMHSLPKFLAAFSSRYSLQTRSMARGRNYYIRGASKDPGISPEARDLIANVRHAENVEEWKKEHGIGDPIKFSQFREHPEDIDNESDLDMTYFPHKGEAPWPDDYEPSPVLLVKRVKQLGGQPWWHKMDCERIGLGPFTNINTVIALPNLSYYNALLYRIKHLIEITAVQFPDGVPDPKDFDAKNAKVTHDGKFLYHSKIGEEAKVLLNEGPVPADQMKMTRKTWRHEAKLSWSKPWNSPYGNANYNRDNTVRKPDMKDYISDPSRKVSY